MVTSLIEKCGILFWFQLAVNMAVVALIVGYLLAWRKNEILPGERPWNEDLEPLANISCSLGLLGSVIGFICGFLNGFQEGIQVDVLCKGLGTAFYTTGVGIFTSLLATMGAYFFNIVTRNNQVRS